MTKASYLCFCFDFSLDTGEQRFKCPCNSYLKNNKWVQTFRRCSCSISLLVLSQGRPHCEPIRPSSALFRGT